MTFQELQEKYEEALSRVKELEKENARLKRVLQEHRIAVDEVETIPKPVPKRILSVEERVKLFRSLFKGREDVFARRWFSKATGNARDPKPSDVTKILHPLASENATF